MSWFDVSEVLPPLNTPVLAGWFGGAGCFVWGCYVRVEPAGEDGWSWARVEFPWLGDWCRDDYAIEFWVPVPKIPTRKAGGAA